MQESRFDLQHTGSPALGSRVSDEDVPLLLQQAVDLAHEGEQFCRVPLFLCELAQLQPSFSRFVIHVLIRAIAGPFIGELRSGSLPTVYVDYTTGT